MTCDFVSRNRGNICSKLVVCLSLLNGRLDILFQLVKDGCAHFLELVCSGLIPLFALDFAAVFGWHQLDGRLVLIAQNFSNIDNDLPAIHSKDDPSAVVIQLSIIPRVNRRY